MGKDYTPQEMHYADTLYYLSEIESKMTQTAKEGRFPNLGYLFCNRIDELVDAFKRENRNLQILDAVEKELASVIKNDDADILIEYQPGLEPIHTIIQWYLGKLDPEFHYRTRNDAVFFDFLMNLKWEDVSYILYG